MVNPGSFAGKRKKFLDDQSELYAAAVKANHVADTVTDIQRRYFKRFPIALPHAEDPSDDFLASVDDDAPEPEVTHPKKGSLTEDEYARALRVYELQVAEIKMRKAQIKRRLHYQYAKSQDQKTTIKMGTNDPMALLMSKLTGNTIQRPRLRTAYNLWGPANRFFVDPVFSERVKDQNLPATKHAALRSSIYKELFEELPEEERLEWTRKADLEHQAALAKVEETLSAGASKAPEDLQRVIECLPKFIEPILDLIAEHTGWKVTLLAGGPEPADGGRLNMVGIHSGTTSGAVKMNFGRSERVAFKDYVVPTFGRFLKKCYSVQECRELALPDRSEFLGMMNGDDYAGFDVHTFGDGLVLEDEQYVKLSGPSRKVFGRPSAGATSSSVPSRSHVPPQKTLQAPTQTSQLLSSGNAGDSSRGPTIRIGPPKGRKKQSSQAAPLPTPGTQPASRGPTPLPSRGPTPSLSRKSTPVPLQPNSPKLTAASSSAAPPSFILPSGTRATEADGGERQHSDLSVVMHAAAGGEQPLPSPTSAPIPSSPVRSSALPLSTVHAAAGGEQPLPTPTFARASSSALPPPTVHTATGHEQPLPILAPVPVPVPSSNLPPLTPVPRSANSPSPTASSTAETAVGTVTSDEVTLALCGSTAPQLLGPTPTSAPSSVHSPRIAPLAIPPRPRAARASATNAVQPLPGSAEVPDLRMLAASQAEKASARNTRKRSGTSTAPVSSRKKQKTSDAAVDSVDVPSGSPPWAANAVRLFRSTSLGPEWDAVVSCWLKFEEQTQFNGCMKLGTHRRPRAVGEWIKWARTPKFMAHIHDLNAYASDFNAWWQSVQPEWRVSHPEIALLRNGSDWEDIRRPGVNGLVSILAGLFFWGHAMQTAPPASKREWLSTVEDVNYTINRLI